MHYIKTQLCLYIMLLEEMHTEFWLEDMKGREHVEDVGVDGKIILEWI